MVKYMRGILILERKEYVIILFFIIIFKIIQVLLKDSLTKCSIVQEKWSGLFHTCAALLEQMGSIEHTIEPTSTLNYDTRDTRSASRTSNCSVCSVEVLL